MIPHGFDGLGFSPADILLPEPEVDLGKWAVVACDQFTSEPEYWEAVKDEVGAEPSTLKLILPEAQLSAPDVEQRIEGINETMRRYLDKPLFTCYPDSVFYVERMQSNGRIRHGLIGKIDLETYDFHKGSDSLVRASEGTVLSRIPPRVRVRKGAALELPHIMLLLDDPEHRVIESLAERKDGLEKLYDFDLMKDGGHIAAWKLDEAELTRLADGLRALAAPQVQLEKYGKYDGHPLLYVVGDGNHSLASAKACYEAVKERLPLEEALTHPARYALVELVNNHDDALEFEPIHRVVFGIRSEEMKEAFLRYYPNATEGSGSGQRIDLVHGDSTLPLFVPDASSELPVGTLQIFLDALLKEHPELEIDYIHGDDVTRRLSAGEKAVGFLLPAMQKEELFRAVLKDGALPRKTFSMGHARDKRYYLEARTI